MVDSALLAKQEEMEVGRQSNVIESGIDLGQLIAWLLGHQDQIKGVIDKVKQVVGGGKKDVPIPPAPPAPVSVPVTPTTPPVIVPPASDNYASIPSGLFAKLKGLKRDNGHIDIGRFKALEDPAIPGDVINFDIDPLDAHGEEIETDTPPLVGLLKDPAYGTYKNVGDEFTTTGKRWEDKAPGYNNHLLEYTLEGGRGLDLVGEYRNYGCGINLKVPRDWVGDTLIYLTPHMTRRDGKSVVGNRIGPYHVKSS